MGRRSFSRAFKRRINYFIYGIFSDELDMKTRICKRAALSIGAHWSGFVYWDF
jgi:hypothetical protein